MPEREVFEMRGARLVLGDAKELAQEYAGQADLVLSDPPYKLTSGGRPKEGDAGFRRMGGIFSGEAYDNSGLLMAVPSWVEVSSVITTLAAPRSEAYVMANDKNIFQAQAALAADGWRLHNLLVWDKVSPVPNRWYMKHAEFVLYMWKGPARAIANKGSKQITTARLGPGEPKVHPTQKPLSLLTSYVENSTDPGQLVIDPYAGSGSTLIAAARAGRRAVGFELCPDRFRAAAAHIRASLS